MNFIAPLFLLGGLAIAAPVAFHLIRRVSRDSVLFSSLMFLRATPPRLTRKSQVEHWFILLLRCVALLLLALGFSRPFWGASLDDKESASTSTRTLILLDSSASMRRQKLWAEALEQVDKIVSEAGPSDELSIYTFGREFRPILRFGDWAQISPNDRRKAVGSRLSEISCGWSDTRLGNAMMSASELLSEPENGKPMSRPGVLMVLSDFQEGSHFDVLQGYEWPKGVSAQLIPLKVNHRSNAGLTLGEGVGEKRHGNFEGVRVRVANAPESKVEHFRLSWSRKEALEGVVPTQEVYVPPGQSRMVLLPFPTNSTPADTILLSGDDDDFDNRLYIVPPEVMRSTLIYRGNESSNETHQPLYYLQHALAEMDAGVVRVLGRPPGVRVSEVEQRQAKLTVVTDRLPADEVKLIQSVVKDGGKTALVVLKSRELEGTLNLLLPGSTVSIRESKISDYAILSEVDFRHPLFSIFGDPKFGDFTKIHFWKHRSLNPNEIPMSQVVAKFDDGDPAVIDVPLGKGHVVILTAGWHPEDSQFALSSKFVPFISSLLEQSGGVSGLMPSVHVGDSISLSDSALEPIVIERPDGRTDTVPAGSTNYTGASQPGIYAFHIGRSTRRIAVNLEPSETRTSPISPDEFEKLGVPIRQQSVSTTVAMAHKRNRIATEIEGRQKLWRGLLAGTFLILLLESAVAARVHRFAMNHSQEARVL